MGTLGVAVKFNSITALSRCLFKSLIVCSNSFLVNGLMEQKSNSMVFIFHLRGFSHEVEDMSDATYASCWFVKTLMIMILNRHFKSKLLVKSLWLINHPSCFSWRISNFFCLVWWETVDFAVWGQLWFGWYPKWYFFLFFFIWYKPNYSIR